MKFNDFKSEYIVVRIFCEATSYGLQVVNNASYSWLHHSRIIYSPGCKQKSCAQAKAWVAPLAMSLDATIYGIPYWWPTETPRETPLDYVPIKTCLVASYFLLINSMQYSWVTWTIVNFSQC